ncbi:SusD/RagB family nutrient-binding outer membrane lipoprotein [uncultured Sunxiuqinia sp.]|uniref:SusD/RagB family nutrient-binding outer membrane lipoprotein n=1 Tax=uncultured Sunxiuqinia sp. TaxID=1573825 RepID=UPI002AA6AE55|nr:SusD/RagB family nutrient-binding outer membrane lipoprotein [uncultured Sunxiuqinia sp.]
MKILKYFLILSVIFSASCSDYLDINKDPNSSDAINPEYLFNYGVIAFSANRNGGDGSIPLGFGSQIWATGWSEGWGTGSEDTYEFSVYTLNNTWSAVYVNTGKNLNQAIQIAENSVPKQSNAKAQCMIMQAYNFYQGTTLFGDMPFTEALKLDISEPKFDTQKDVLEGIIKMLDDAIDEVDLNSSLKIDDYFYGGDMERWIKAAKSLKFRTLMLMVDADNTKEAAIKTMLIDGGMISSTEDEMIFPFIDKTGNKHPMRAIREKYYGPSGIEDMFPGKSLVDIMNLHSDPRRPVYFRFGYTNEEETTLETNYIGCEATVDRIKNEPGATSFFNGDVIWAGDKGDEIFTYSEQLLLEAEAQIRFNNDLSKGRELFEDALEASCTRWGITTDLTEFKKTYPEFTSTSVALKAIYEEFWVDQMVRPGEAWTNWRRSGTIGNEIPALSAPENAKEGGAGIENMFRRYTTPPDVSSANPNAPEDVQFYDRLWFDK